MRWPATVGEPTDGPFDPDHVIERWEEIEEIGTAVYADGPDGGES